MDKEDYFKYYIQGSDHYLIPKDVFIELFNEMSNWKEETKELNQKYLNAVADYEKTEFEKEQLNSLVNSCQEEIRQLKKQVEEYQQELECTIGIVEHNRIISEKNKEIHQLKDNWNNLKEYLNYQSERVVGEDEYIYDEIYNEMQDLEKGSDK